MQDNMVLITAIAKLLNDNGIMVKVNKYGKDIANEFYLESATYAEFEGKYKTAILAIKDVLDTPNIDDFVCVEKIINIMEDTGVGGGCIHDF